MYNSVQTILRKALLRKKLGDNTDLLITPVVESVKTLLFAFTDENPVEFPSKEQVVFEREPLREAVSLDSFNQYS